MAVSSTTSSTSKGIDVPTIVSGLMEVERQPVTKLQTQIDQKTLMISTLGVFKSKVSALESAAKSIQNTGVFALRDTASSDATKVSATASNAATAGAYSVKVAQTAQAETSTVGGFASATQVVGLSGFALKLREGQSGETTYSPSYVRFGATSTFAAGDVVAFTLRNGSEQTFTVSTQTTATEVASAINSAAIAGNFKGVAASVDADGYLQLSSSNPLQGMTGALRTPGHAEFSATSFSSGDVITLSTSGGSQQTFLVTTQNTTAKIATAINAAVSAGTLSGISASVVNNKLRITAIDPTKSVSAALSGSVSETAAITVAATRATTTVSAGLSDTANISNVAAWINALGDSVKATIVQRSDGKYALNVMSTETGAKNAFSISGITTPDAQKDTVTLSGTYAAGDVIVLTVNDLPLIYTVTANDLTGDGAGGAAVAGNSTTAYNNIAKNIALAFEATDNAADTAVNATFSSLTPGVVTLTAVTAGTAFTSSSSVAKSAAIHWTATANGVGVKQIDKIQVAGTYAVGDVVSITVGGVPLSYSVTANDLTVGGLGVTPVAGNSKEARSNIARSLQTAYAASTNSAHTATVATVTDDTITLTAAASGTEFVATTSVTRAAPIAVRAASVANNASPATAQVDTIALFGKYTVGDVINLTVNAVALNYTVTAANVADGGNTAADYTRIAQSLVTAYNASSNAAHSAITASSSGAIVSLTADVAGTGFTASVSTSSIPPTIGVATQKSVVFNPSNLGLTAAGSGTIAVTGVPVVGDYSAIYDGASWIVSAPSGSYSATFNDITDTLEFTSGSVAITVAGVTGSPKAGDRIALTVGSAGASVTAVTLTEHTAIELQSGRDAFFSVNGNAVQRSTNQVNDVIGGVTFNLNSPVEPASGAITNIQNANFSSVTATTINVTAGAQDLSASAVKDLVTAYNDLLGFYKEQAVSSTDATKRGLLNTDSSLRSYMERLRGLYGKGIRLADGSLMSFSSIGVEMQRDGTLYLNQGTLNTAVANGLQTKLADGVTLGYESATSSFTSFLTNSLKARTGLLTTHISDVENQQSEIQKKIDDWNTRLALVQERYYKQYAALDALIFKLQNTSDALGSAIQSLVNSQKNG